MFIIQAHTKFTSKRRFWLDYKEDDKFYVMGKDIILRSYFVSDNCKTPFTMDANTGFVSMDYFWILNYC